GDDQYQSDEQHPERDADLEVRVQEVVEDERKVESAETYPRDVGHVVHPAHEKAGLVADDGDCVRIETPSARDLSRELADDDRDAHRSGRADEHRKRRDIADIKHHKAEPEHDACYGR